MANVQLMVSDGMDQRPILNSDTVLDVGNSATTFVQQLRSGAGSALARLMVFSAPAAMNAGVNGIVSSGLASTSTTMTATIAAQPDMPRNVRIKGGSSWDGGSVTVVGTYLGLPQTEVFTQAQVFNATIAGNKPFTTITSITKSAVGTNGSNNTILADWGDKLGCPATLANTAGIAWIAGTYDAPTLSTTYNTYSPATATNGARVFTLLANV